MQALVSSLTTLCEKERVFFTLILRVMFTHGCKRKSLEGFLTHYINLAKEFYSVPTQDLTLPTMSFVLFCFTKVSRTRHEFPPVELALNPTREQLVTPIPVVPL